MPKGVINEIIKIQRRFLWSGKEEGRYAALVSWEVIQKPKYKGGLGVGDLVIKNNSLLFKWWWRCGSQEGVLWKKVIQSIHNEESSLLPKKAKALLPGPWRDIKEASTSNEVTSLAFFENISIKIGDGSKTLFWIDPWSSSTILRDQYPSLYKISFQKKSVIADMGWFEGPTWRWSLSWTRNLNVSELAQLDSLTTTLIQSDKVHEGQDKVMWAGGDVFQVSDLVVGAVEKKLHSVQVDNLICCVWLNLAPPKAELMVWIALQNKLSTIENLHSKGQLRDIENLCTFCKQNGESTDHLLVTCKVSWELWCKFIRANNMVLVIPGTLRDLFSLWMDIRIRNRTRKKLWKLMFFAISWSLWRKRNNIIFQEEDLSFQDLVQATSWRVALWAKAWNEDMSISSQDLARFIQFLPHLYP